MRGNVTGGIYSKELPPPLEMLFHASPDEKYELLAIKRHLTQTKKSPKIHLFPPR